MNNKYKCTSGVGHCRHIDQILTSVGTVFEYAYFHKQLVIFYYYTFVAILLSTK